MSLKIEYANEIAEAMAKSLDSKEFIEIFKTASLEKEAGRAFDTFKAAIDAEVAKRQKGGAETDYEQIYTAHLPALEKEENTEPGTITKAREYIAKAAATPGARQPGEVMPADDKCMCADKPDTEMCAICGKKVVKDADEKECVAADFALNYLSSLANALDERGFNKIADFVDEAMQKIAKTK